MDRKYTQRGYQDRGETKQENHPRPQQSRDNNFGPRALNMPGAKDMSRCAECGAVLAATVDLNGACPQCGAALHACKQCTHFDPASRFECRRTLLERVTPKDKANTCRQYEIRVRVERETSNAPMNADDARKAFERLFKK